MARIAAFGFLVVLALYSAMVGVAYWGQRAFQYMPTHLDQHGDGTSTLVPWRDDDGGFLGYVRPADATPERVVVLFHGTGGEALNWSWYESLIPTSQTLVLAEYPGFGARGGEPTERSILRTALDLMQRVHQRWDAPITLIGESLGTGVATYVAARVPVDRLALVSPFSSVLDVAAHHLPFLPVGTLLQDRFLSLGFAKKVTVPLFVLHGQDDEVVPLELGYKLFQAYPGREKFFTVVPGAGHYSINYAINHSPSTLPYRTFIAGGDPNSLTVH